MSANTHVLPARRTASGHDNSLQNTQGARLADGAQCFVIDQQANYRFIKSSVLNADGTFVVAPSDSHGRWVREQGLVGFAILQDGKVPEGSVQCVGYKEHLLVQFAVSPDGWVIYTGIPPRFAFVHGFATHGAPGLVVHRAGDGALEPIPGAHNNSVQASCLLQQGDRVSLQLAAVSTVSVVGGIHIVLT